MKYILPTLSILYIFSLLGELGAFWWVFDLFAHWRVIYVVGGLLLLTWALLARQAKWAFINTTIILFHVIILAAYVDINPFAHPVRAVAETTEKQMLTVAFANTYWKNSNMDQVILSIKEMNADVIFLEEIQPEQFEIVRTQLPEYTFSLHAPVDFAFDMGVLSKVPVKSQNIHFFLPEVPLIELVVDSNGKELHLLGVHPHSPVGKDFTESRNKYLHALFEFVDASSSSIVMGGDYNITQFSPVYRELMQDTRMLDTQKEFPLTSTWPTSLPEWMAIPIDQVFVTSDVTVSDRYRGSFTGSDHWPIVVKVAL